MAGEDAHELERRAGEGAPADQAASLRARIKDGSLDPARLPLLAYLGHAGARLIVGGTVPVAPAALDAWRDGLLPLAGNEAEAVHELLARTPDTREASAQRLLAWALAAPGAAPPPRRARPGPGIAPQAAFDAAFAPADDTPPGELPPPQVRHVTDPRTWIHDRAGVPRRGVPVPIMALVVLAVVLASAVVLVQRLAAG